MIKLIHIADLHSRREAIDKVRKSLDVVSAMAEKNEVDLICISGDTWDQAIHASAGSGFNETIEDIQDLAYFAPVVIIYGTPSHDIEGSLDVFRKLDTVHGITVIGPKEAGKPYFLGTEGKIREVEDSFMPAKAVIFGVPEPSKKWLMPALETKTAAEAAVRDGLGGFFLGLGGLRKKYSEVPCVLMYHGQVAGARLQNGDTLDRGEGIRATIDDLAAVGADYIALGDIHQPQQVGESIGLPAFYPGSCYPINFGESHDAGLNLVTITAPKQPIKLDRISFGHPINRTMKVRAKPDLFGKIDLEHRLDDVAPGQCVKLEITVEKEHAAEIDLDALNAELERLGAAPGSKVELNVLPTETVRAGEIAEIQDLPGKVKLWAENSGKVLPDMVYALAAEIESEAKSKGMVGSGARIRLDKLILRGAKGLKAKSRLDEVVFDFGNFDSGLIAILGKNGDGKTTLLENMHPWPCMLTRGGVIKDHFFLRDSMRDLYWTDMVTGYRYHALITIDAGVKSGGVEYYLYQDRGAGFDPMTGINGRKEPYETEINRIFGSMDLYLRSAFVTQRQPKGLKDLGEASPGERKALFSELVGLEYFESYKTLAKTKADKLENNARIAQAGLEGKQASINEKQTISMNLAMYQDRIPTLKSSLESLVKAGQEATEQASRLTELIKVQDGLKRDIQTTTSRIDDLGRKKSQAEQTINALKHRINGQATALETVEKFNALKAEETEENERYRQWSEENRKLNAEYQNRLQAHADEERRLRDILGRVQREQDQAQSVLGTLAKDRERLQAQIDRPAADHCPTCRQMLPDDALAHVLAERAKLLAELNQVNETIKANEAVFKEIIARKDTAEKAVTTLAKPDQLEVPHYDSTKLSSIKDALSWLDIEAARVIIASCQTASSEIGAQGIVVESCESELAELNGKLIALRSQINTENLQESLGSIDRRIADLRDQYTKTNAEISSSETAIKMLKDRLEVISKIELEISEIQSSIDADKALANLWRILETACSDKGIPALELDAVAPGIASIANNLLKEAFDSRYQIEFSTTRIGGSGQQIEGFDINVLDTRTGESQEISTLSGGESVWIRRALYDAFGIIRARNTGLQFLTVFMDEADGALDPEARVTYLRMLESAHQQAGRAHSLIITHSPELQALIQQTVQVRDLPERIPIAEAKAA